MTASQEAKPRPLIHTGSLLNSSEGILSVSCAAALTQVATTTESEWVACCACVSLALVACVYMIGRTKAKVEA